MTPGPDKPEIAEEFHDSPHYQRIVATNVFGGIAPGGGGLFMDMVLATVPIPKAIFYEPQEIEPGVYQKGPEIRRIPAADTVVIMERQVGVYIPGPNIRSIANWLQRQADDWERGPGASPK